MLWRIRKVKEKIVMGYPCKVQRIARKSRGTYYVNLPTAVAEALEITKGEVFEWYIEDKNTLVLQRRKSRRLRKLKHAALS
jgi:antitoxin component of MazEF toxin-antitoxin module